MSSLPVRLALALVASSSLLFLATHLASSPVAIICVATAFAVLAAILRDEGRTPEAVDPRLLATCLAAGSVLCALGGEAHLFYANDDWLIRDAVLGDLVAQPWPVGYLYGGDATLLRAPLGMYLLPAAVGKLLGFKAAHVALFVQNGAVLGCALYGIAASCPPLRRSLRVAVVFVALSGWDVVGQALLGEIAGAGGSLALGTHLESWLFDFQFSSHVTQAFWAPNHALAGWVFVAAYLAWRRGALGIGSVLAGFGFCAFWSPLSMIGALPFALRALAADLRAGRIRLPEVAHVVGTAVATAPILLYLVLDASRVPHGETWAKPGFAIKYPIFLMLELVPLLVAVALLRRPRDPVVDRIDLRILVAILMLVPFVKVGGGDFTMRVSIPALALLAVAIGGRDWPMAGPSAWRSVTALAILAVGAVTPFYEVARAVIRPAFAVSRCNLVTAALHPPNDGPLFHYLARTDEVARLAWLFRAPAVTLAPDPDAACWPDRER